MAVFSIQALASEITNDPASMGYAALKEAAKDQAIADLLNSLTSPGAAAVFRNDVSSQEFLNCITTTDFAALTQANAIKLQMVLQPGRLDATNANLRAAALALFSGATLTAMQAVVQRTGSRAEVLWGTGFVVTAQQVGAAR